MRIIHVYNIQCICFLILDNDGWRSFRNMKTISTSYPLWANPLSRAVYVYAIAFSVAYMMIMLFHYSGYKGMPPLWPFILLFPFMLIPLWRESLLISNEGLTFRTMKFGSVEYYQVVRVSELKAKKGSYLGLETEGELVRTHFGFQDTCALIPNCPINLDKKV